MAQFPNIPDGEINRIMKLPVDEQKKILTKLMRGQKIHTDIEQKIQLEDFDITGQKGHATGGRVSLSAGGLAGMLGE